MHHTELASRRRSLRLSQSELAERLGVHPNTVAKWERGDQPISRSHTVMLRTMLRAIEDELRNEPPEQQAAREERWRKWLRAEGERLETQQSAEERAAAEKHFGKH